METEGGAGCAQVVFRVRCDKIGHGESLFLSQTDPIANRVSERTFTILSECTLHLINASN